MVTNFQNNVVGQEIPLNYGHDVSGKAAGWIKNTYAETVPGENKTKLKADIEWTPAAAQAIREKEYRYLSAEFTTGGYKNSQTEQGKKYSNVLTGAALTNIPFLKQTNIALSELETKGAETMNKDQMIVALKDEHGLDLVSLQELVKSSELSLADVNVKLSEANAKLAEAITEKEKLEGVILSEAIEGIYDKAFTEGKIVPAQKEMFCGYVKSLGLEEGKKFSETLPVIIKLDGQESNNGGEEEVDLTDSKGTLNLPALDRKVKRYMKENNVTKYEVALRAVQKGGK